MPVPSLARLQDLQASDTRKEYLSGGYDRTLSPLLNNAVQVLGQYHEDLTLEFTDKVYEEMLKDPAVAASVDILRALITVTPPRLVSRIADKKHPQYKDAREAVDFVEDQLKSMNRPVATVVAELMDAVVYGSCVAEIVYEDDTDDETGAPYLRLADVKAKSRRKYALVTDRFYNILGVVSRELGYMASGVYTGSTSPDPKDVIPRDKIVVLTLNSRYGDPRGYSMLRPAYAPYYIKTQVWPQFLKFLMGFASPSLVGYTPEGDNEEIEATDDAGNPIQNTDGTQKMLTPEEDMFNTLLGFQGGTLAVLKGGSKLDVLWSQGGGEAFLKAIDLFDRQIAMAILKTHRTLLEAKHSSKADSESAQDITDVYVALLREVVGGVLTHDLVYQLVFVNKGKDYAKKFSPIVSLQTVNKQDFAKAAEAVGKLWTAKYLHPSQVEETDALVGLPPRDMDAFLQEIEQMNEDLRLDQMERLKLLNPGAGANDDPSDPAGAAAQAAQQAATKSTLGAADKGDLTQEVNE